MSVWVRRGVLVLLAAIALAVVGAYALPRQVTVTRSVEVDAPRSAVFAIVSDLRRFADWSSWLERDPDIVITFTGPVEGVGQAMAWESDKADIGSGRQTITRIALNEEIEMEVAVDRGRPATAWLTVEATGATTMVTWSVRSDVGASPVARYLGLGLERRMGPGLSRGLGRLRRLAEAQPKVG